MFLVFKTAAKPSNLELKFGFVPGRTKLMRLSFGMENKRDANAMDIQCSICLPSLFPRNPCRCASCVSACTSEDASGVSLSVGLGA